MDRRARWLALKPVRHLFYDRLSWCDLDGASGTQLAATLASISAHPSHDRAGVCVKVLSVYAAALTWHTLCLEGASHASLPCPGSSVLERLGSLIISFAHSVHKDTHGSSAFARKQGCCGCIALPAAAPAQS